MGTKGAFILIALGLWLLVFPWSFSSASSAIEISDAASGLVAMALGFLGLATRNLRWIKGAALVGLWLQLAPLVFWAPEASSYANDTLVGMMMMFLPFCLQGLSDEEKGEEVPPGWSFNPSAWGPRGVTVFLALVAWFLARYLASYQLGYIHEVKDPFFGDGTLKVISSSLAQGFPVSDAGLGAFGYSLEFLLGFIGSSRRWKTMPWVSALFGLMVIPAGMISILLIVLQPLIVGAWCGICLMIAVCMLVMVLLTIPELAATFQILSKAYKSKKFWTVFWKGETTGVVGGQVFPVDRNLTSELGFTLPWNLVVSVFLGVWLMGSPSVFGSVHPAADANYIVGPLCVAASVISFSEILRCVRFFNLLLAVGLVISAFALDGLSSWGWINNLVVGICIFLLSFSRGKIREKYGVFISS